MAGSLRTRREILVAGMAGAFGLALAACSDATIKKAASVPPASKELDLGAIEHVVFLMNENRSFDHYFGTYRGVRGFDDPSALSGIFAQAWPPGSGKGHDSKLLPFHLDTQTSDAECTYDLSHAWNAQHLCWNNGAIDRFVSTHTSPQFEGPDNGVLTMGYYKRADLPFWYAVADAFTICDNYHCSVFGPTHPNRLHGWTAFIDPDGKNGGPVVDNSEAVPYTWTTYAERLQAAGITWRNYQEPD